MYLPGAAGVGDTWDGGTAGILTRVAPPTTKGLWSVVENVLVDATSVQETWALSGLSVRSVTGATNTDAILFSDTEVDYEGSVAVATSLSTPTTFENPSMVLKLVNETTGVNTAVTVTATTLTFRSTGSVTKVIAQHQACTLTVDPTGTVWDDDCHPTRIIHEIAFGFSSPSVLTGQTTCGVVTYSGTITGINWITDISGGAKIDVTSQTMASYHTSGPTGGSDIANTGDTMTTDSIFQDTTLSSWTTALTATAAAPKVVCFVLSIPTTIHTLSGKVTVLGAN